MISRRWKVKRSAIVRVTPRAVESKPHVDSFTREKKKGQQRERRKENFRFRYFSLFRQWNWRQPKRLRNWVNLDFRRSLKLAQRLLPKQEEIFASMYNWRDICILWMHFYGRTSWKPPHCRHTSWKTPHCIQKALHLDLDLCRKWKEAASRPPSVLLNLDLLGRICT